MRCALRGRSEMSAGYPLLIVPSCRHNNRERRKKNKKFLWLAPSLVAECWLIDLFLMPIIVLFHLPIGLTIDIPGEKFDLDIFRGHWCSEIGGADVFRFFLHMNWTWLVVFPMCPSSDIIVSICMWRDWVLSVRSLLASIWVWRFCFSQMCEMK